MYANKDFFRLNPCVQSSLKCLFVFTNSLKLECEKLASEKTEMQRHYVMVIYFYVLKQHERILIVSSLD